MTDPKTYWVFRKIKSKMFRVLRWAVSDERRIV